MDTGLPQQEEVLFKEEEFLHYDAASNGQRFLNLLIDGLFMRFGLGFLTGYLLATIVIAVSPDYAYELFSNPQGLDLIVVAYLLSILNYLIYYTICEKAFKGYTLGKLLTGTRAIRQDGKELTFRDALLRSLSRLVPFEPFSIWFGDGLWHDSWTKTMVVKARK